MTNEEKAEEYAGKKCANCIRYYCKKQNKKGGSIDCCNEYLFQRKHFLAGLAEGKPKWHEIESHVKPSREIEKQYMPKGKEKVLLKYHFYGDEEIHYSDGYYDPYDFEFHIPNNPTCRIICVIAWCELYKE